jgi:large subunit ribosomal protein L15
VASRKKTAAKEAAPVERIGLYNLSPSPGSHRDRKRLGRGPGSGTGKTSGKGHKGSKARTGHGGPGGGKPHFEGGQMPLTRRLPKRGFTPPFRVENQPVALDDLARVPSGTEITHESLAAAGLIQANRGPAKLLANGELTTAVVVRGVKLSAGARQKIEAAGGRVEGEPEKRHREPAAEPKETEKKAEQGKGKREGRAPAKGSENKREDQAKGKGKGEAEVDASPDGNTE